MSIEIRESGASSLLPFFRPVGRAIYGLSASDIDSPDMASCYCDARYNACLVAEETHSVMGAPNSGDRKRYCETGIAPSVGGFLVGMRNTIRRIPWRSRRNGWRNLMKG